MTYLRHSFPVVRVAFALLFTLTAITLASWAIAPALGTTLGVGYPVIVSGLIWWRWSFDRTTPRRWMLTGIIVAVLALMAAAGWSAADSRDLELAGKVTTSVLASFFFLLLLGVALDDNTSGKPGQT